MLIKHIPLYLVVMPASLPDGRHLMSVSMMPSVASNAVPRFSTPTFMCFVYLRIESNCGHVTSYNKAISITCVHKKILQHPNPCVIRNAINIQRRH